MESTVAMIRACLVSDVHGEVIYVDSKEIKIKLRINPELDLVKTDEIKIFNLKSFKVKSKYLYQKPTVKVGDVISKGDVLADGQSTNK